MYYIVVDDVVFIYYANDTFVLFKFEAEANTATNVDALTYNYEIFPVKSQYVHTNLLSHLTDAIMLQMKADYPLYWFQEVGNTIS